MDHHFGRFRPRAQSIVADGPSQRRHAIREHRGQHPAGVVWVQTLEDVDAVPEGTESDVHVLLHDERQHRHTPGRPVNKLEGDMDTLECDLLGGGVEEHGMILAGGEWSG